MTAAYECNGQPVSAEAFYAIACDPRRSVAVEACAGAGKTWMLVSRILRALLEGTEASGSAQAVQPHEILAITFTRKAAGEMRERLDEWLKTFANADDETLRQELLMRGVTSQADAQAQPELRRRLAQLYRTLLASGRSVQIRTFHSWFSALLRSAPVAVLQRLGLPVNYELLEDDAPARAMVWRRFYAEVAADEALKADFEALVQVHGRFQADKALQSALNKRTEFTLADENGVVDASVQPFAVAFPEFAGLATPQDSLNNAPATRQLLLAAAKALGSASAPTFSAKGVALEQAIAASSLPDILAALLTDKGLPRKFGEKIVGIDTVRQAQDLVLRVLAAQLQHDAWLYQQRMARLTRVVIAQFTQLKREHGWVDMNDVERAALVMLADPVLAGWVQERLDARIRHLMIDEFQDTNPLQWQALSSWLSGYGGAGSAPSVFLVGDPKQSIYRFRRAEPQVFRAAQAFVVDGLGGDLLSCDHTRRNAQSVIATVNAVMGQAREQDGYDGFRTHTTDSPHAGYIGYLPPIPRPGGDADDSDAEDGDPDASLVLRDSLCTPREVPEETLRTLEARQAAAWIAEQLALGLKPSDVMVLSRKRAGLLPLQLELRALQIPAQIGEKTELMDCCEVQDIVALLDVLVSTQHDLSLARVLRSPLFGLSDDSLISLALLKRELNLSWYDLLQKTEHLAPELIGLGPVLAQWKGLTETLPPHDALQAIYEQGDVLARFAAAAPAVQRESVLANLRALLAVALDHDGGRYATPYGLVRALKAGGLMAPVAVNADATRLLTIHGAKGLEAQAVLLIDTDTLPRNPDSMGVLIDWPGETAAPRKFIFLVSESRPPACAETVLAEEQAARQREELNALYVALTRARNTLVISSIEPHRSTTGSWFKRLQGLGADKMPALGAPVLALTDTPDIVKEQPEASFSLPELPALPDAFKVQPQARQADSEDAPSARIGKAMHRLLEWGGGQPEAHVKAAAREFRLSPEQTVTACALARSIAQGEGAWAWEAERLAWQGNEVELVYDGQTLRLDRLVQRKDPGHEDHWWVLDYKSALAPEQQPALMAQLRSYQAAVQLIYPGATVKAAFLGGDGRMVALA